MAPVMLSAPRSRFAFPVFVIVTDCGRLLAPTTCEPNDRVLVERDTAGAGAARPVPDNETLEGLPAALLPIVRLAERGPCNVGPKLTDSVQELLGAGAGGRVTPEQELPAITKSPGFAPARLAAPRIRSEPPMLVTVMTAGSELALIVVLGNTRTFVESPKIGAGAAVPVPLSWTVAFPPFVVTDS